MSSKQVKSLLAIFSLLLLPGANVVSARQQTRTDAQGRPELTEEFHQTYPLAADGRMSLSNINGRVRVTGWDRNEVRVDAVKRAFTQERLREAQIKVEASQSEVRIETKYPDHAFESDEENCRGCNRPASVEYTISVPRGARLDEIELVNGALDLEELNGNIRANTVNGTLTARSLSGTVRLSVVNGRLDANFERLPGAGNVTLDAVNGPLMLTIPSDANALLKASTVHGSITNDFNLPVRTGQYVGRNLEGRLGAGNTSIKMSNVNGTISINHTADNRPLSPVTNLLSETGRDAGDDFDAAEIGREAAEAARRSVRSISGEDIAARRDAERARADGLREAQRVREEALRDAEREQLLSERERERAQREAERDVARQGQEIAREVNRNVQAELKRSRVIVNATHPASVRVTERVSNTLPASSASRVRIENFDGPITIHAWDRQEVQYTALKRGYDDKELKGIKINTQPGNTGHSDTSAGATSVNADVTIRSEFDKAFAHDVVMRGGRVVSFNSAATVELDVYVPRDASLNISSGDGRLRVEGTNGAVELHTGDGAIDVSGGRGRQRAETGDGHIRIENFDGEADARTGDGRITLDGRFQKLSARTGEGTIALNVAADLNATIETDARNVVNDSQAVAEDANETEPAKRVRRFRVGSGGQIFNLKVGDGQIILNRR